MPHPNEYPGKTFIPYEGDMQVETLEMPDTYSSDREGVFGVTLEDRSIASADDRQTLTTPAAPYWENGDKIGFGIGEEPDGRP